MHPTLAAARRLAAVIATLIALQGCSAAASTPTITENQVAKATVATATVATATPVPTAATGPVVTPVRETRISTAATSLANRSREPIVTIDPLDGSHLALAYPQGGKHSHPVIRISRDGGTTWTSTLGQPRGGGSHPEVAFGPGPRAGHTRLYYVAMGGAGNHCRFEISYSDNDGRTWSAPYIASSTTPWFGGYPDMTVDTDPASPNHGVVWLAYTWPQSARGPGMRVLASANYGRSFSQVEVPAAAAPAGYGDQWRIGYRVATAPDGSAYVAAYQLNMRNWNPSSPFSDGGFANVGRIAFTVTRITFDRSTGLLHRGPTVLAAVLPETRWNLGDSYIGVNVGLTDPEWAIGLATDPDTGDVYLAAGASGGILACRSADAGATWSCREIPRPAPIDGRRQYTYRPELVAGHGFALLTMHSVDRDGSGKTAGYAYAISTDGARTFSVPDPVTTARWRIGPIIATYNGVGMRNRTVVLPGEGAVFAAYGDGRSGYSGLYGTLLRIDIP